MSRKIIGVTVGTPISPSIVKDKLKLATEEWVKSYHKANSPQFADEVRGEMIILSDSVEAPLQGLKLYGKTTQNGTPAPEAPVPLDSVGDDGNITVNVGTSETDGNPQTLIISTPNGLPGIPVTSGGNYTDVNGQRWICDEVDFEKGVYVQRVVEQNLTAVYATNNVGSWKENISQFMGHLIVKDADITKPCFVTHGMNGTWFDSPVFYAGLASNGIFTVGGNRQKFGETADSCNAYLNELNAVTPVKLLYALKNTIETVLPAEQLAAFAALHTNYPNTTVFNEEGAGMEVKYVADTKLYIDKKFAELAAAIVNS